jgi:hypothetical protein
LLFFSSCHEPRKSNTPTALLGLHIHTFIDTNLVDPSNLNVYYPDSNGRVEKLNYAQFYLTNVSLHSMSSGNWVLMPGSIMLKREENEEYVMGNVPADSYDDIRFTVGLDPSLNNANPSSYSTTSGADTVLSTNESLMYFGNGQGYKFIALDGYVDTSAAHNQTNPIHFSYAIGGNGDTVQVTMKQQAFTLAAGVPGVQFIHIIADYGKLIQTIDMSNSANRVVSSPTAPPTGAAATIWNRILNMFRYECTTPNGTC